MRTRWHKIFLQTSPCDLLQWWWFTVKEDEGRTLWLDTQSHVSSSASSTEDDYSWHWPTSFWSQFKASIIWLSFIFQWVSQRVKTWRWYLADRLWFVIINESSLLGVIGTKFPRSTTSDVIASQLAANYSIRFVGWPFVAQTSKNGSRSSRYPRLDVFQYHLLDVVRTFWSTFQLWVFSWVFSCFYHDWVLSFLQFLQNAKLSTRNDCQDLIDSRLIIWLKWSENCHWRLHYQQFIISLVTQCWASIVLLYLLRYWRFYFWTR